MIVSGTAAVQGETDEVPGIRLVYQAQAPCGA